MLSYEFALAQVIFAPWNLLINLGCLVSRLVGHILDYFFLMLKTLLASSLTVCNTFNVVLYMLFVTIVFDDSCIRFMQFTH
jgi:hypothetical protein